MDSKVCSFNTAGRNADALANNTNNSLMLPDGKTGPLNILIVDDHEVVREGVHRILAAADEAWQISQTSNPHDAIVMLRCSPFDVAIVDLSLPGMGGLDLIKRIKADHPHVAILVLSMHAEEHYAVRALKAGARGYVTKDGAGTELVKAVRKMADGGSYITPALAERVVLQFIDTAEAPQHEQLSDRELGVLRRLVAGERLTDIAEALNLSVKTVSTHKSRIQNKLKLPNLASLVRYGIEQGLDVPRPDNHADQAQPKDHGE